MFRLIGRTLSVTVLCLVVFALVVQARPQIRRGFVAMYPKAAGTRLDACVTCHTADGTALNPYGASLRKSMVDFNAVEKLDSDGDGYSNKAEIDALRFPGDPMDHPGVKPDSAIADTVRHRPAPPDTGIVRPDTSGSRPDTLRPPKPHKPPEGGARPDTLKPPKNG
jgi:hypothetical protein